MCRLFGLHAGGQRTAATLWLVDAPNILSDQSHRDPDGERMFALITAEIRRHDHEVEQGLVAAVTWIAQELPVYCLNLILSTATDVWALRHPATNELHLLQRPAANANVPSPLDARSRQIHARSDEHGWRPFGSGELVHVDSDLTVTSSSPFPATLRHPMTLQGLAPTDATTQRAAG